MAQFRWILVVPLVAVLLVALVFYVSISSNQVSYSISTRLLISIANRYSNTTRQIVIGDPYRGLLVGVPGGFFASTRYSSDGVNGYYPLFTKDYSSGKIYTVSKVHRNYTLGDFFEVWGEPLGPFDTLGWHANLTSPVPFAWSMCLLDPFPHNTNPYAVDEWGSHVLRDNETITLIFSLASEPCA